jgi:hypothetical protein
MKILLPITILGIILGIYLAPRTPHLFTYKAIEVNTVALAPTPTPPPTDEEVLSYIVEVFSPEGRAVVVKAMNCFYSESGLRWDAISPVNKNGTRDGGIAQINDVHKLTMEERLDYKTNINKAYDIYVGRGHNFSAWYGIGCK